MKNNLTILYLFIACNFIAINRSFGQNESHIYDDDGIIYSTTNGTATLTVDTDNGRVGVNTTTPTQTLEVNGKVLIRGVDDTVTINDAHTYSLWVTNGTISEDLFVTQKDNWADYVFDTEYKLMDLNKLKLFIDKNQHLPGIPTAKNVAENGYSQHELNVKYLEKVEELVLYTIEQQSRIDELVKLVSDQEKMLKELKAVSK